MKKNLKLEDLKVQSFVTNLSEEQSNNAMGGQQISPALPTNNRGICQTLMQSCITGCVSCPECPPM